MRLRGQARAWAEQQLPTWEDIKSALSLPATQILGALNGMPNWQNVIASHCFGQPELFQDGEHTDLSR